MAQASEGGRFPFACSTRYFLIYCGWKNNRPQVNPEIMLPGFISGALENDVVSVVCAKFVQARLSEPVLWC